MGAKVDLKTYFPGSMADLSNGFRNGVWELYHDDKTQKISGPTNSHHYDYFLTTQAMNGYTGYAKEQIRQTILKHESIFRHQLQELHRLYKRQRDLMNPETSKMGDFVSRLPSDVSKETHTFAWNFSPVGSIKGKSRSSDLGGVSERRVIDLELPANVDENFRKGFNLADLNEPVSVEQHAFSASVSFNKRDSSAKRTLFGVEICDPPTFHSSKNLQSRAINSESSPWIPATSSASTFHQNHWIFAGSNFVNGFNSKDPVSEEKHTFLDMWKNPEQKLPPWLMAKPCAQNGQMKAKEMTAQQFFKKAEVADTRDLKKAKLDDSEKITKILGVPITDRNAKSHYVVEENSQKNCVSDINRNQIDLNLSLEEEDPPLVTPSFPESIVKIATMEIDLEAPAVFESDNSPENTLDLELVKIAAEAIVSISSLDTREHSMDTLMWLAELITSDDFEKISVDEYVLEGMDDFEYLTLKLRDTNDNYVPMIIEEKEKEKDEEGATLSKRTPRKGQGKRGRPKKDFQKDILPSIVSLSRREVTEDIQIFEEAFSASGGSWQSSLSKRRSGGRGRRRLVAVDDSCNPPPAVEENVCREIALEKTLGGWGRRTRRLPRQRCQNHQQSLALKC